MSNANFIASLRARRTKLAEQIRDATAANEGVLPKRETQHLRKEIANIDDAIRRANSKGVSRL